MADRWRSLHLPPELCWDAVLRQTCGGGVVSGIGYTLSSQIPSGLVQVTLCDGGPATIHYCQVPTLFSVLLRVVRNRELLNSSRAMAKSRKPFRVQLVVRAKVNGVSAKSIEDLVVVFLKVVKRLVFGLEGKDSQVATVIIKKDEQIPISSSTRRIHESYDIHPGHLTDEFGSKV